MKFLLLLNPKIHYEFSFGPAAGRPQTDPRAITGCDTTPTINNYDLRDENDLSIIYNKTSTYDLRKTGFETTYKKRSPEYKPKSLEQLIVND